MQNQNVVKLPQPAETGERFALRITAVTGVEEDIKDASGNIITRASVDGETYWSGRKIGKQPRKDLQLSCAFPQIAAATIAQCDMTKLATIVNDDFLAYSRRVKCQRLNIGDSIEIMLPIEPLEYAELAINMLSSPAERSKKLVSTASIRALLLSDEYRKTAAVILGSKLENWKRIGEREFIPLAVATDAKISLTRESVRDSVVIRCEEIAAAMPECDGKTVLSAVAGILAELQAIDLDDSI